MQVKLKDQTGMFHDPETGFGLVSREVKPLPQNIGQLTRRWLNAGGLVKVVDTPVQETVEEKPLEYQRPVDAAQEYLANFDRSEMMRLCKERGIKVTRSDKAVQIAAKLAKADTEK